MEMALLNQILTKKRVLKTIQYSRKASIMEKEEILIKEGFQIESIDDLVEKAKVDIAQTETGESEGENEADRLTRLVLTQPS